MLLDANLMFDMGSYVAANGVIGINQYAGGVSTNVLDMINARDMGQAPQGPATLQVMVLITTTYVGGTSMNIQLQGSSDNVTWTTYSESGAVPIAQLVAGNNIFNTVLPGVQPDTGVAPRYYRLNYVPVGTFTAGAVIAGLMQTDDNRYYKPGVAISN